jgi:PhnB protein
MALSLNTYLSFDGNCEAAFRYYQDVLKAELESFIPFRDSPVGKDVPKNWQDKVMHACLRVGEHRLMGSDGMPGQPWPGILGLSMSLNVTEVAEAERLFGALAEGGRITMPLEKTFWSPRFGMLTDRFGVPWMVNVDVPPKS